MKDISDFKPQFNILLSMEFGSNKKLKYDDEMKWLKDQFFTIQKYCYLCTYYFIRLTN